MVIMLKQASAKSSDIHKILLRDGVGLSLVTVKRSLSRLLEYGFIESKGAGRSLGYSITVLGRLMAPVNAKEYCSMEPDARYGLDAYNHQLFKRFPKDVFDKPEIQALKSATKEYKQRIKGLSPVIQKKELERLVIELSWKSSKIEGNTYTLLDTEKLILENKMAAGHSQAEAQMIINHKNAFYFIWEHASGFKALSLGNLEKIHSILVHGLSIKTGLRKNLVGVLGSRYKPLDNGYQIKEAVEGLSGAVSRAKNPYSKSMIALLGISYIQPFEDGNKRTSRLMANALLLSHGLAPLSYRSVEEDKYREAMLVFYELNSIMPFRKIFIDQYEFAARNYAVGPIRGK